MPTHICADSELIFYRYINDRNIPIAKEFFPNATLEPLEAGHWGKFSFHADSSHDRINTFIVHAEKYVISKGPRSLLSVYSHYDRPNEFKQLVTNFIKADSH